MNLANLARHSRNQKLSDSLRLRVFVVKAGPNPPRRREESRRVFDQWKNSFQLAKDFRVSSTDPCSVHLCSSVCICSSIVLVAVGRRHCLFSPNPSTTAARPEKGSIFTRSVSGS